MMGLIRHTFFGREGILLCLLVVIFIGSCTKDKEIDLNEVAPDLVGSWTWNETKYFWLSDLNDIDSLESKYQIEILENGTVRWRQDGLLSAEYKIKQLREDPFNIIFNESPVYREYSFDLFPNFSRRRLTFYFQEDNIQLVTKNFPLSAEKNQSSGDLFIPFNIYEDN